MAADGVIPIALLLGPTAGGKTTLAIELARRLPAGGECVSADSMQVYRGMDIGTAKPTAAERAAAPHHLLDIADPATDGFSVETWLVAAERVIAEIRGRGRTPIVVGGTNLYVKALLEGMFEGPAPDAELRERLLTLDDATLRTSLERVDPVAAERIHPNDRKRTVRAIEVYEATGRPISELQQQWDQGRVREDVRIVGLDWPAPEINRRINARVAAMFGDGLVAEVAALQAAGRLGPQAAAALGYRQILDHLAGRTTLEEAREQIKIRTRRFAKQQRTWLRRFRAYPNTVWLPAAELTPQDLVEKALAWIAEGG
ncbi:MAG: tRNA (adenosine(37)-N6)-dimethylallyltransferase MiaA [Phycisphaerales bacterium]|nr:tRNA (adenosine(37)-N6)-dimethylallyltransferase MiaA [Phycisphaerae bacterium]NNF43778.1 tRNA (adenosine(37)-N6)-dimethylallyltransferase MiaA [Phycisphaerales bacterium]NNM27778.1 tRNA (adenosine(37)-N6)-dimethylallyltransferase MiaA [Phycisphaerales bacterium]